MQEGLFFFEVSCYFTTAFYIVIIGTLNFTVINIKNVFQCAITKLISSMIRYCIASLMPGSVPSNMF